jgi:hypothetical protein
MLLRHASAAGLRCRQTALRRTQTSQPLRSRRGALAHSRRGALAHAAAATSTLAPATAATGTQTSAWPAFLAPIVNRVTDGAGLGELQRLKAAVNEAETAHEAAVAQRAEALRAHDALTHGRSTTQADLTVLLQRRDAWDADDVKKFTRLTSDEHDLKTRISESLVARESSERAAEAAERAFLKAVRSQYHGELMWQEKYRALSLYSTWALIVVNSLVFVGSGIHRSYADRERLAEVERAASELSAASQKASDAAAAAAAIASDAADRAAAALAASQVKPVRRWPAVWTAVVERAKRLYAVVGADPRAPAAGSVLLGLLISAWRWR